MTRLTHRHKTHLCRIYVLIVMLSYPSHNQFQVEAFVDLPANRHIDFDSRELEDETWSNDFGDEDRGIILRFGKNL